MSEAFARFYDLVVVVDCLVWYTEELYAYKQYVWHWVYGPYLPVFPFCMLCFCSVVYGISGISYACVVCVSIPLDMAGGGRRKKRLASDSKSAEKKKHSVGLPTTLLKEENCD